MPLFTENPRETVRKALIGFKSRPYGRTNRVEKTLFSRLALANSVVETPLRPLFGQFQKVNSRKLRERHKDKEQDAYTFYSTEALITKIARVKHLQARFAPAKQ